MKAESVDDPDVARSLAASARTWLQGVSATSPLTRAAQSLRQASRQWDQLRGPRK